MRAGSIVVLGVTLLVAIGPGAAAQQPCGGLFPGEPFGSRHSIGAATLRTSGLAPPIADRIAGDLGEAAELIGAELGGLDGVEICVFADELPLDAQALGWPEGQRLRAISFGPERVAALSAWQLGLVQDAGTLALAHQAQWAIGDGHYPDPLGGAVGQWYASRLDDRLGRDHAAMRYANLVRGIPEDIPWTGGAIPERLLWNPESQLSPIGDFVDHAVADGGLDVIREPRAARLREAQAAWQRSLLAEATGSEEGTKGWIVGAVAVGVILAMAAALVATTYVQHRRQRRAKVRETVSVRE